MKTKHWIKKNRLILGIFLGGLVLRIFIIPITLGMDTESMYYLGQEIVDEHKGIYEIKQQIAWPPPYPWIIKICFLTWRKFFPAETFDPALSKDSFEFRSLATIFKIPPLLAEITIGILIYCIFKHLREPRKAKIATALWFFNPVCLLINTMWGKFDVISAMFVVGAAYFFLLKKYHWSALSLGLGIAVNMWPIILIPVLFFSVKKKSWLKALGILLITILPFILVSLPYLKAMPQTYLDVISGKKGIGEQHWIFGWRPPISWFVKKPLTLSVLFALFFLLNLHWKFQNDSEGFCGQALLILAAYFVFSPYAPQFLIWFYPLLLTDAINNYKKIIIWLGATLAIVGIFFFWGGQDSLSISLLAHNKLATRLIIWKRTLNPERYNLLFETMSALFTGAMLSYILLTLKSNFSGLFLKTKK